MTPPTILLAMCTIAKVGVEVLKPHRVECVLYTKKLYSKNFDKSLNF